MMRDIIFDFEYARPRKLTEAVRQFHAYAEAGKKPLYYGGGTEIITLGRWQPFDSQVVIDIKGIAANHALRVENGQLRIGATRTLSELTDDPLINQEFPLLKETAREIADRTARNKITLGGNICGQIFYREAVLPFLLCDSRVILAGPSGIREVEIMDAFDKRLQLLPGEFLVHLVTDEAVRKSPFIHLKRRKAGNIGYPVVTIAAIHFEQTIRIACSGLYPFPFRSRQLEVALNQRHLSQAERVEGAIAVLSEGTVLDDLEASRQFRLHVLRTALKDILQEWGNGLE